MNDFEQVRRGFHLFLVQIIKNVSNTNLPDLQAVLKLVLKTCLMGYKNMALNGLFFVQKNRVF